MGKTSISWTGKTWNVTDGCRRKSAGCENCYAERQAARFSGKGLPYEGLVKITKNGPRWTGAVKFSAKRLAYPLRWREPQLVFVDSMSDLFYEKFTNEQIAAVFGVMAAAHWHTFQILTKRSKRMREWFAWVECEAGKAGPGAEVELCVNCADEYDVLGTRVVRAPQWPLPNVWIGVSCENQDAADERVPDLLHTPAVTRFLSCEPLIGPIDLLPWFDPVGACDCASNASHCKGGCPKHATWRGTATPPQSPVAVDPTIDLVIAGCESGPKSRPCDVDWLRALRDQCDDANVDFFLKQAETLVDHDEAPTSKLRVAVGSGAGSRKKGRGPGGFPIIELPYLDGVQHAELPSAQP